MARSIDERLRDLRNRRKGFDRQSQFTLDAADAVLAKSFVLESYTERAPTKKYTKYALGAMQEVDPEYTAVSIREANRVQNQLDAALKSEGIDHSFELQGSVPANLHIRGISDVDLLVIDERFFSYDVTGPKAVAGHYSIPYAGYPITSLMEIRKNAESTLSTKFPSATVDKTGAKAIKISGGSLLRPVDVVPANWYDTPLYQSTGLKRDRGIQILDKLKAERINNQPFRHIHLIDERDLIADGGLRKAIRLCKNVRSDAEGGAIDLSSFDIASAMWHANLAALRVGRASELAILAETQRHLDSLATNHQRARLLLVPDGSRFIFDEENKLRGLNRLSREMDDLMLEVAKELPSHRPLDQPLNFTAAREGLQESWIPY